VEKIIKILPIPETMQGISTSAESKEERSKKKTEKNRCTRGKDGGTSFTHSKDFKKLDHKNAIKV
jgi:hypothetical protein